MQAFEPITLSKLLFTTVLGIYFYLCRLYSICKLDFQLQIPFVCLEPLQSRLILLFICVCFTQFPLLSLFVWVFCSHKQLSLLYAGLIRIYLNIKTTTKTADILQNQIYCNANLQLHLKELLNILLLLFYFIFIFALYPHLLQHEFNRGR